MESQGKRSGFTLLTFRFQWSNHHIPGRSKEGFHPSLYDLGLEWPKADTLPHQDQLIDIHLRRSPTGTFFQRLCPLRTGDDRAQLAGKQSCHPRSGPRHGEAVYLTLVDNIDQSADSASPHNQRDPSPKIGLIGHHQEHHVFVVTCDPLHLHVQDDKPKWASIHPTQHHEVHWVVHKVFQREDGEPVLLHQSRCDHIHLTATVRWGCKTPALHGQFYQRFRSEPMSSGPSHLQPWVSDPSDHADVHLQSRTSCPRCGGATLPCPFGICLVLVPLSKCLMVGAASGKMDRRPTHKTLSLFPLVSAHSLGQAHINATHRFYFGLRVLPCDLVGQRRPLFLQGCHQARRHDVAPVFVPICLRAGGIPASTCRLSHFQLLSKHV